MIESYLHQFPLELIGAAVVSIATIIATVESVAAIVIGLGVAWVRCWTFFSNLMWRGYDPTEQRYPPLYRLRLAGVTIALARFKFRKIPAAWREAEEIAHDELTAHLVLRNYLKRVFMDD